MSEVPIAIDEEDTTMLSSVADEFCDLVNDNPDDSQSQQSLVTTFESIGMSTFIHNLSSSV